MNKQELKSLVQANLASTDADILALVPVTTTALGRIDGANKLDLVTLVIGGGLDDRCDAMIAANTSVTHVEVATKIKKALAPLLLMSSQYWINLGVPEVKLLVDAASSGGVGLLTDTEYAGILALATYIVSDTSWVTLADIANARLIGTQTETSVTYDGDLSYLVRLKTDTLNIYVTRATNLDVEQTIKIYAHEAPKNSVKTDAASYIKQEHPIRTVTLSAGSNGKVVTISTATPTATALQFSGESGKLIPFDMIVEVA